MSNRNLSDKFRLHVNVMIEQLREAKNDSEGFGAIITCVVVLAREFGVDPHEYVTAHSAIYDKLKADGKIP